MANDAAILAVVNPMIERDEGFETDAYLDTRGNWTIGFGRCDPGVVKGMTCTRDEAQGWMDRKVVQIFATFDKAAEWWRTLDPVRAAVMVDVAYNVGAHGFLGWRHVLGQLHDGDWAMASADLLMTEPWAEEVGDRAQRLAAEIRTGVVQT